ncbi:MAG: hypothetical protein IPH18_17285 [Chitinophagaceae bacterium]|nr:hypothetical protein [Chitinophagaceae bacterium]
MRGKVLDSAACLVGQRGPVPCHDRQARLESVYNNVFLKVRLGKALDGRFGLAVRSCNVAEGSCNKAVRSCNETVRELCIKAIRSCSEAVREL